MLYKNRKESSRLSRRAALLTGSTIFAAAGFGSATPVEAEQAGPPGKKELFGSSDKRDLATQRSHTGRISRDRCCGIIVDVQGFFLSQIGNRRRIKLETDLRNFARLLGYFRIPLMVTLEQPVDMKGPLPKEIRDGLGDGAETFAKDFFDLTREMAIADHLSRLMKPQVVVVGCETDVCVLQSCLSLLRLGYEVYLVEDLLFSTSRDTQLAVARMEAEGAVFLTYKTLYYELVEAVPGSRPSYDMIRTFGPFPRDLPDTTVA